MIKLTVVIPCYNEEKNIPLILERFKTILNRDDIQLLLVNNGSTDNSETVLKELIPKYSFAKTLKVPVNQGYGYGILQGLKSITSPFLGWTHADMQTDPFDIIRGLELLEKADHSEVYVKGNRQGRSVFDQFFTIGMSFFESLFLRRILWDINAQPNLFPKSFFASWKNPPSDFSLDLYALYLAKKNGLKVIRFDVQFPERIHGTSSWNTGWKSKWKFIKRTLEFSFKLRRQLNEN